MYRFVFYTTFATNQIKNNFTICEKVIRNFVFCGIITLGIKK